MPGEGLPYRPEDVLEDTETAKGTKKFVSDVELARVGAEEQDFWKGMEAGSADKGHIFTRDEYKKEGERRGEVVMREEIEGRAAKDGQQSPDPVKAGNEFYSQLSRPDKTEK